MVEVIEGMAIIGTTMRAEITMAKDLIETPSESSSWLCSFRTKR